MKDRDPTIEVQLKIIDEAHLCLTELDIPHWLYGGWGVDFLLGQVTRPHGDIDWLIWESSREKVSRALTAMGYAFQKVRHPDEHIGFWRHDQYVSFTLNTRNRLGQVVTCGRWQDWPYPLGAFEGPDGELQGIRCPVLSAEAELDVRENFHKHPSGGPRREIDDPVIAMLRKHLENND